MKNPIYEQALNRFGIAWQYRDDVHEDQINVTRGKQLQARLEPLDHNLIEEYANLLKDGSKPPPCCCGSWARAS